MVVFDGAGFDWSCMVNDEVPTNMALMDFLTLRYNVIPPPPTGLFSPPKLDLSNSGLEEFQQHEFGGYEPKIGNSVSEDMSNEVKESVDASLVKELVSDDKPKAVNIATPNSAVFNAVRANQVNAVKFKLQEKGVIDSGCSRHMTGNMFYLCDYEEINGGYVAFRRDPKGCKITGKGKICTDTECVVLPPDFKLLDERQVLLSVPGKNNMYSVDLKNVAPSGDPLFPSSSKDSYGDGFKPSEEEEKKDAKYSGNEYYEVLSTKELRINQDKDANVKITNTIYTVSPSANAASIKDNVVDKNIVYGCVDNPNMPNLEEINYSDNNEDSAFMYDKIEKEVYVCQPLGFKDPKFPDKFDKVEKALYGLHQAPRTWHETLCTYLLDNGFHRGLQVTQKDDGIFISQDKYVYEILKKFGFSTVRITSTPMETSKPLYENTKDVDVQLYRLMIGSLMYLTSSRPDNMFGVCACARFQITPKVLHLYAMKRIFRYLKGQSKLGFWYLKDSPYDLEAYTDSDYAGHVNEEAQLHAKVNGKRVFISEALIRSDLRFSDKGGIACLPNEAIFEQLTLMGAKTTAWNEFTSTIASVVICLATNQQFNFSKYIFESMEDASKQERIIDNLDADEGVTLVDETQGRNDQDIFDTGVLDDKEVVAKKEVSTADSVTTTGEVVTTAGVEVRNVAATPTISMDDITLAKALATLQSEKPMGSKDKGKAKMIEHEKPLKKKDQIMIDKEVARNLEAQLQAELEEEERLPRQKEEEANIALISKYDDAFDNTMSWINSCVPTEKDRAKGSETRAEGSSKRAGEELESDKSKKQKVDEQVEVKEYNDQEKAEIKMYMKIISNDEIALDAIPLATKPPIIVD
uniref:Uncharacterized protein n=1 Tax=Tanacetum cinerariifolium TaxID=118510 RepID=A0A6L2J2Q6_TANCI|nr:hypothetical protein [Tanacetum cinerariifolium]